MWQDVLQKVLSILEIHCFRKRTECGSSRSWLPVGCNIWLLVNCHRICRLICIIVRFVLCCVSWDFYTCCLSNVSFPAAAWVYRFSHGLLLSFSINKITLIICSVPSVLPLLSPGFLSLLECARVTNRKTCDGVCLFYVDWNLKKWWMSPGTTVSFLSSGRMIEAFESEVRHSWRPYWKVCTYKEPAVS